MVGPEPGLDLHEWQTRWEDLQEAVEGDPGGALREMVLLLAEMLRERGFELDEPVTAEGDDPEVLRDFLAARDVAAAVEAGSEDPEDIAVAIDDLREIYEYLTTDRAPP